MKKVLSLMVVCISMVSQVLAQEVEDLFELSLEELMSIEITSVSKTAEKLQDVASSIYVITQQDIERSGATRIQDLLNMVPGFYFAHTDYNAGASGAREAINGASGSVLLLLDNVPLQSVYLSVFDYGNFDIDLEEIDRIEVIKGPGGTIYGANAATGIISIFTKSPEDSQGFRATFNQGTNGFVAPSLRYGTEVGNTSLKFHAKGHFFNGYDRLDEFDGEFVTVPKMVRDASGVSTGVVDGDTTILNNLDADIYQTRKFNIGVSASSKVTENTTISGHAYMTGHDFNVYAQRPAEVFPAPFIGFSLNEVHYRRHVTSARLDHNFNADHSIFVQFSGNAEGSDIDNTYIANLEIQDNLVKGKNLFSFGLNGRIVNYNIGSFPEDSPFAFVDPNATEYLWGIFAQDKINFSDKFNATLGIKAETWTLIDNEPELSPSLRLAYKPSANTTFWGAGSRSVTTPGFVQTNVVFSFVDGVDPIPNVLPDGIPETVIINSDNTDQTEYLTAELGFKSTFGPFRLDVSGFYAEVDGVIGVDLNNIAMTQSPLDPNQNVAAIIYDNVFDAKNYGMETVLNFIPSERTKFELSYTWFSNELTGRVNPVNGETFNVPQRENPITPEHIIRLRSYFTFKSDVHLSLNSFFRTSIESGNEFIYDQQSAAGLAGVGVAVNEGDDRFRLDLKLAKEFNEGKVSIYVWGTDIFNTGLVEQYSSFQNGIPKQIHNLFGAGATISF